MTTTKPLRQLTREERRALLRKNNDLRNAVAESCYETNMFCQRDEFEDMGAKVFDYHDHYCSFYLSTPTVYGAKAPEQVANALDSDYLSPEEKKVYDELCAEIDKWENMDWEEQDANEELYDHAIELCDELADKLTDHFRAYEEITEEQMDEEFEFNAIDGYMSEWTTDGEEVYETITKIYK